MDDDVLAPMKLTRTKSWKEYEDNEEIPLILSEGLLPIKFQDSDDFQDLDFEGALRFYYEDGQNELTKAVRLTNKTKVEELIPILVGKFSLPADITYTLYEIHEKEDIVLLYSEECPLARAISTKKVPRFILRKQTDKNSNTVGPEDSISQHSNKKEKRKSKLFGIGSRKESEKGEKKKKAETEKQAKSKKKKSDKNIVNEINHNTEEEDKNTTAVSEEKVVDSDHVDSNLKSEEPIESECAADLESLIEPEHIIDPQSFPFAFPETTFEFSEPTEPVSEALSETSASIPSTENSLSETDTSGKVEEVITEVSESTTETVPDSAGDISFSTDSSGAIEHSVKFNPLESVHEEREHEKPEEPELTAEINNDRKLSFSNSSIFFEQDNDPPQIAGKKKSTEKKKSKKKKSIKGDKNEKDQSDQEKRSKSFSKMLKGQKKKDSGKGTLSNRELSTNKLTPGILKVFGDHVSKGSNYKSVRVSTISTAQEVVRMALERYGLENCDTKDYVLCDVVGHFTEPESASAKSVKKQGKNKKLVGDEEEEPKWTTEYVRTVNDNEKPLVLQSLWKPTDGHSRRFELRRRIDIESTCFFINTADGMGRRNSETSLFDGSDHSSIVSGNESTSPSTTEKAEYAPGPLSPHSKSDKIKGRADTDSNHAPQYVPYLLLIQGYNSSSDNLIHKLEKPTATVGPYMEDEPGQCNIALCSSDILIPHCWIYKKVRLEEGSSETNLDEINFLVFVEPANGADITVNGASISTTTLLKPGQLIGFGKYYLFIFKDPTQVADSDVILTWVERLKNPHIKAIATTPVKDVGEPPYDIPIKPGRTEEKGVQVQLVQSSPLSENDHTEESDEESDASSDENETAQAKQHTNLAPRKHVDKSHLQLVYEIKEEDELLHTIIDIADEELGTFKLTPAYFFMMTIEHSAATFTEIQTRKLLLKISSGLQGIAWEKTKEIGKQSSAKEEDPMVLLNRVLPELKPVLFWMASALEMLHFLQCNLNNYLLPREQVTTSKEALLTADEELLTVLEEVIMFTFQQTVYHLTKVLYVALPSIIDTNPFQSENPNMDSESKTVHPSVAKITRIFESILDAAKEYQVHPHIISQLFAYLFFFSNASLFNSLMEKGPGGKFYRWTKGVQMRGNLDVFEDWAQENGLASQFEQYMGKFMSAVDLMATPKVQLMQLEWKQMRTDHPSLNPAQLQQLLGEYQLNGKQRPRGWYPPPDEVEPALRSSEVLESFATHPPLMLPSNNFVLNINNVPDSDSFFKYQEMLREKFDKRKGTPVKQPLKDEKMKDENSANPANAEFKSKKVQTRSNIDMDDVEAAIVVKNQNNLEHEPDMMEMTNEEAQVGSIKSIQVQSRKTAKVTVTTRNSGGNTVTVNGVSRSLSNGDYDSSGDSIVNGDNQINGGDTGVDDLISKARDLINADDEDTDDDEEIDGNLLGYQNGDDDVFVAELTRSEKGLGLGLIDGMFTSLKNNGIYIRTVVPNTPASEDTRLRIGDRILAVNGATLVGADYNHAMDLIKKAGNRLSFLIAKSDDDTMNQVLTAST